MIAWPEPTAAFGGMQLFHSNSSPQHQPAEQCSPIVALDWLAAATHLPSTRLHPAPFARCSAKYCQRRTPSALLPTPLFHSHRVSDAHPLDSPPCLNLRRKPCPHVRLLEGMHIYILICPSWRIWMSDIASLSWVSISLDPLRSVDAVFNAIILRCCSAVLCGISLLLGVALCWSLPLVLSCHLLSAHPEKHLRCVCVCAVSKLLCGCPYWDSYNACFRNKATLGCFLS